VKPDSNPPFRIREIAFAGVAREREITDTPISCSAVRVNFLMGAILLGVLDEAVEISREIEAAVLRTKKRSTWCLIQIFSGD